MGTLGAYLKSAREALGVNLHDAAQQTRISIHYLDALEQEDFAKLPGEVFVKGFLKNYSRFLNLSDAEVMKRYQEMRHQPVAAPSQAPEQKAVAPERTKREEIPLESIVWGAAIFIALIVLLFTSLPERQRETGVPQHPPVTAGAPPAGPAPGQPAKPEKLYLKIEAVDDTWVLVRTDTSPQKKALLKKGETITWSADERFVLSYARVGAVKLSLNGRALTVKGPENAVVRDIAVTSQGVVSQNIQADQPRAVKPKPQPKPADQQPTAQPEAPLPVSPLPAPEQNAPAGQQPAAPQQGEPVYR